MHGAEDSSVAVAVLGDYVRILGGGHQNRFRLQLVSDTTTQRCVGCGSNRWGELPMTNVAYDVRHRASGLFPLYLSHGVRNLLVFSDYWDLRGYSDLPIILTLRTAAGDVVAQRDLISSSMRPRVIDVGTFFGIDFSGYGIGHLLSVEVEVFFPTPPKFTYPAISLVYSTNEGSATVHTCLRTLNEGEQVGDPFLHSAQTGFDVHLQPGVENYCVFIFGQGGTYEFEVWFGDDEEHFKKSITVSGPSHSLHVLPLTYPDSWDVTSLGRSPKVSIGHRAVDVFPRFFVMTRYPDFGVPSLTHTFFDVRHELKHAPQKIASAYIPDPPSTGHLSSLLIPVFDPSHFDTVLQFYNSVAPFRGVFRLALREMDGSILDSLTIDSFPEGFAQSRHSLAVRDAFDKLDTHETLQVELSLLESDALPRRMKLGLDVSRHQNPRAPLGCNICFAPITLSRSETMQRPRHRWAPIGGELNFVTTLHNVCFSDEDRAATAFNLSFFNAEGDRLDRAVDLPPYAGAKLEVAGDQELQEFLQGKLGYVFMEAESLGYDSYFFSLDRPQVSGDHAF